MMTSAEKIEQVLTDFEQHASTAQVQWELRDGEIRGPSQCDTGAGVTLRHCPLSWLAQTEPCDYEQAAQKLGLTEREAAVIANAADAFQSDPVIRRRLLAACRLTEDAS
jgi:hypothetical protein